MSAFHRWPDFLGLGLPSVITAKGLTQYELRNVEPRTFQLFVPWLYNGVLVPMPRCSGSHVDLSDARLAEGEDGLDDMELWADEDLVDLYLFSRNFHLDDLSTKVLATLAWQNQALHRTTCLPAVEKAFKAQLLLKLLCLYLVDEASWYADLSNLDCDNTRFPRSYVLGALNAGRDGLGLYNRKDVQNSYAEMPCTYHIHHGKEEQVRCATEGFRDIVPPRNPISISPAMTEMGTLSVGPSHVRVILHKGLVGRVSAYFDGALNGDFAEGSSGRLDLVEEEVPFILTMVHWMYTREISLAFPSQKQILLELVAPEQTGQPAVSNTGAGSDVGLGACRADAHHLCERGGNVKVRLPCHFEQLADLIALFGLADRRGVRELRNDIMTLLLEQRKTDRPLISTNLVLIKAIQDCLPASSKLWLYIVDEAAHHWSAKFRDLDRLSEWPADFLAAVMQTMLRRQRQNHADCPWCSEGTVERYHEHLDEEEAIACRTCRPQQEEDD